MFKKYILYLTSVILSRLMFVFIDDPEGPNLLVVFVGAVVIYFSSQVLYRFIFSRLQTEKDYKKILLSLIAQVVVVLILFLFLR